MKNNIEIADIFNKYGAQFRYNNKLSSTQLKVMKSMELCRTAYLGGHVDQCDHCVETKI